VADLVVVEPPEVSRMTGRGGIEKIDTVFLFTKLQRLPLHNCAMAAFVIYVDK